MFASSLSFFTSHPSFGRSNSRMAPCLRWRFLAMSFSRDSMRTSASLNDAVGLGLPAVSGNKVAIVLHYLRPIVHEVLIDIVLVDERLICVVDEQVLGKRSDDFLWMAAGL